jgi:hypothetical protein
MALVVANCYQITVNGNQDGHTWANVFHVQPAGAGAPTVVEAAETLFDAYTDNITPIQCTNITVSSANYVDLSSTTGDSGVYTPVASQIGGNASASVPPNTAVLFHWQATGGRSQRPGRSYIPGIQEASVNGAGIIDGGSLDGWIEAQVNFLGDLSTGDLILSIVSKSSPTTGTARTVIGNGVDSLVATQRRRLRS